MPNILITSSLTSCGAVAVSARMGTLGRMCLRRSANCFYAGRKSCPHEDTTWHSSITIRFTFTWFITLLIVSFTVSISGVMNRTLTVPFYNALNTCAWFPFNQKTELPGSQFTPGSCWVRYEYMGYFKVFNCVNWSWIRDTSGMNTIVTPGLVNALIM